MKERAFTLVELLAVIVILGLLTVLIVPKVTKILDDSEKNTNMTSAQNLARSAQQKATNNEITGKQENIKINYQTGENKNYLEYTGDKPTSGQINIKANGDIAMAVRFGDYCYLKKYNSDDINVIEYNDETCNENAEVFINYTMPELAVSGPGLYKSTTEPNRYIYRGNDTQTQKVNNWIWLDENGDGIKASSEYYRIISYESDGTIKVIRNDRILKNNKNTIEWDEKATRNAQIDTYCTSAATYGCNAWGTQSNTYYHDTTLTNLNQDFFYKYYPANTSISLENYSNTGTVTKNASLNTYLNDTWINTLSFADRITEHPFYVGGVYITNSYKEKQLEKIKDEEQVYTWNGKIALMTISEYQEASLSETCSFWSNYYNNPDNYHNDESGNRVNHYASGQWPCAINNWTYTGYNQWSLSSLSNSKYVVCFVYSGGYFNHNYASSAYGVRPVFYLKSSIKLGGFGTSEEPFYIID